MKNIIFILIALALVSLQYINAQTFNGYLVKINDNQNVDKLYKLLSESSSIDQVVKFYNSGKTNNSLSAQSRTHLARLAKYYIIDSKNSSIDVAELLQHSDVVESIEPNYIFKINQTTDVPNDPFYSEQWGCNTINVETAWEYASGDEIVVGVIDTGIDFNHPDLVNQLWINSKEDLNQNGKFDPWSSEEERFGVYGDFDGIDSDGNGYIDDVIGYDLVDQTIRNVGDDRTPDPIPWDEHSHGTRVSGVIAAERDNELGVVGVAYGAKILAVRAFDAFGNAESDDIAAAIVYAAIAGADVLNFSFGEYIDSKIQRDAVLFANSLGCVMVASSGNDASRDAHYPSDYDKVISVGASTQKNERAAFSDYGIKLDLIAPGVEIWTTNLSTVDGGDENYIQFGGTSAASPFVSATAALLLSKSPKLSPEEIRGIIRSTAASAEWDRYKGSGVLDAGLALTFSGSSDVRFHSPLNDTYYNFEGKDDLPIIATIKTPLFDYYQLSIGLGKSARSFDTLTTKIYKQTQADTLIVINKDFFRDTTYTLRLLIMLKNNKTIEERLTLHSVPGDEGDFFLSQKEFMVFNNDKRDVKFAAVTKYVAKYSIRYWELGNSDEITELTEVQNFGHYHEIITKGDLEVGIEYKGEAIAVRNDGMADTLEISFAIDQDKFPTTGFINKYPTLPPAFLNNKVSDLYSDGKATIAVNDLSSGTWGATKTYQFADGQFTEKDSYNESWLPKGMGDSNEDGIEEIFCLSYPRSTLFQSETKGGNPFEQRDLYNITDFLAQDMYDLDNDGNEELIALSSYDGLIIMKYVDGEYVDHARAELPEGTGHIGTAPGFAMGDFDNDGFIELVHSSRGGYYYVYKYRNGALEYVYHDETVYSYSSQYMAGGDFDGDGIDEFAILNYGTYLPYENVFDGYDMWNLRVIKYQDNQYKNLVVEHFHGVRGGSAYSNGMTAGNVDTDNKDEIIAGIFPNFYIFKFNNEKENLEPMWYFSGAFSNSAVVYDFDGNGVNEVGFTSFGDMRFVEFDAEYEGPESPLNFKAWAQYENSARLTWKPAQNADTYEIFRLTDDGDGILVGETSETAAIINGLEDRTWYRYTVRSVNKAMQDTISPIADIVRTFTHEAVELDRIEQLNAHQLKLTFTGEVKSRPIEPAKVILERNGFVDFVAQTILPNGDSSYVATFHETLQTEELTLKLGSFLDFYNSPTIALDTNIKTIEFDDKKEELYLQNLKIVSKSELLLSFSAAIKQEEAKNIDNYSMQPIGEIALIETTDNDDQVRIYLEYDPRIGSLGKTYSLTASNIHSTSSLPMTLGAGKTLSFVFSNPNLDETFVFPNPVRLKSSTKVSFANLTSLAVVEVYHIDGRLLAVLDEIDGNGAVEWDCRDTKGDLIESGIYFYKVKGTNTEGVEFEGDLKKFAVIR
jgi:subtilisin family serine protease